MKVLVLVVLQLISSLSNTNRVFTPYNSEPVVIASGQMPAVATDRRGVVHLVYGAADSLLYRSSNDNGRSFSAPVLIARLPGLNASATRGPQIAAVPNGLSVVASTSAGSIHSFVKNGSQRWAETGRVTDMDSVALEGFVSLTGNGGSDLFAAWLDVRQSHHNKIYGARSTDGGRSWSHNVMVYTSPDSTVCECCKPTAVMSGNNVYVMFRNWIDGNRDMYLIHSGDKGKKFGNAEKLGTGSWALKGCPMDGGSVIINNDGKLQTVWNRKGVIYSCVPSEQERGIGRGRSCTMASAGTNIVYAWVEDKQVVIRTPGGTRILAGKGSLPVLKAVGSNEILCVWENEKHIQRFIVTL